MKGLLPGGKEDVGAIQLSVTADPSFLPPFEFHLLELYFPAERTEVRRTGQNDGVFPSGTSSGSHGSPIIQVEGTWGRHLGRPVRALPRGPRTVRQSLGPTHGFVPTPGSPVLISLAKLRLWGPPSLAREGQGFSNRFLSVGVARSMRSPHCCLR